MAEDFVGLAGRLEEEFVSVPNNKLIEVAFETLEVRAAKEKPQLMAGLKLLKTAMGESEFNKLINPIENVNLGDNAILMLTGNEKIRTALTAKWIPAIQTAFGVDNVRIVGGGRNGIDAY